MTYQISVYMLDCNTQFCVQVKKERKTPLLCVHRCSILLTLCFFLLFFPFSPFFSLFFAFPQRFLDLLNFVLLMFFDAFRATRGGPGRNEGQKTRGKR